MLAQGQKPETLVIACADSRVDPSSIFDAGPGELFVIRNVANLVPPFEQGEGLHGTSAALEYAVQVLKVRNILVLGHADCGGVRTALAPERRAATMFIGDWIALLDAAIARLPAALKGRPARAALERESIRLSLERLMSFPFVAQAVQRGKLTLYGGVFGVADGHLELLEPGAAEFKPALACAVAAQTAVKRA
ncbi:MAG: carbonic anhydrase [Hyphomonadaceae bacterium]